MLSTDWIEHRRGRDGERLGWIAADGENFIAIDLLGREVTEPVDWVSAEERLEELGIGYLADPYELHVGEGTWLRVRITEVSSRSIKVSQDHGGAIDAPQIDYSVAFPMPADLRPRG